MFYKTLIYPNLFLNKQAKFNKNFLKLIPKNLINQEILLKIKNYIKNHYFNKMILKKNYKLNK